MRKHSVKGLTRSLCHSDSRLIGNETAGFHRSITCRQPKIANLQFSGLNFFTTSFQREALPSQFTVLLRGKLPTLDGPDVRHLLLSFFPSLHMWSSGYLPVLFYLLCGRPAADFRASELPSRSCTAATAELHMFGCSGRILPTSGLSALSRVSFEFSESQWRSRPRSALQVMSLSFCALASSI